jgi:hypothetical protein
MSAGMKAAKSIARSVLGGNGIKSVNEELFSFFLTLRAEMSTKHETAPALRPGRSHRSHRSG